MAEIRNRFLELTEYIKSKSRLISINTDQLEAQVANLEVTDGGHQEFEDGIHFASFAYDGMIYIERLKTAKLALLAMTVKAWLDTNDDMRSKYKLPPASISTVELGSEMIDVLIDLKFVDEVSLVKDVNGTIDWYGEMYEVGDYPVDYAETGTVNDAPITE